jgi:conjugal transfer ATP-binding protein TraC
MKEAMGGLTEKEYKKSMERDSFSDFLPWVAGEGGVYAIIDNEVCVTFECRPFPFAPPTAFDKIKDILSNIHMKKAVVSVSLYGSEYVEDFVGKMKGMNTRKLPVVDAMIEERSKFMIQSAKNGQRKINGNRYRNHRLFISLKIPNEANAASLVESFRTDLKTGGFAPKPLETEELLKTMRGFFGHEESDGYSENRPIRKQIIDRNIRFTQDGEILSFGKKHFIVQTPRCFRLDNNTINTLDAHKALGDFLGNDNLQIQDPFLYTINYVIDPSIKTSVSEKTKSLIDLGGLGSLIYSLKNKIDEYKEVETNINKQRFVSMVPVLIVKSSTKQGADQSAATASSIMGKMADLQREEILAKTMFITALPGGFYAREELSVLERDFPQSANACALFAPIQADYRGMDENYHADFIGRKGQVIGSSLFDEAGTNMNFANIGGSGGGKSVITNHMLLGHYANGVKVRGMDLGDSYKKATRITGGRYIDFDKERHIINPFDLYSTGEDAEDKTYNLDSIGETLTIMALSKSGEKTNLTNITLIDEAVREAIKSGNIYDGIDFVEAYLLDYEKGSAGMKDQARLLGMALHPFTSKGQFGSWFNGKSTLDIKNDDWVILELEKLNSQKQLFPAAVTTLMNLISADLYLGKRDGRRIFYCDEAWLIMKGHDSDSPFLKALAELIAEGYRRARKYDGSFGVCLQSLNDLNAFGPVGNVIMANAQHKTILKMDKDDLAIAKANNAASYSGLSLELIEGLKMQKGQFSEVFFDGPRGRGVARLVLDDFSYAVYTSSANENAIIESFEEQGLTTTEALHKFCEARRAGRA